MKPVQHLLQLLKPFLGEISLSILLGIATVAAGIGLLGTSSWLIASAALHPSIADLQVAIVGVRFFGISRGVFRYLERLLSHSVNLNLLSNLREDFYRRIEPGAPANLNPYRSGDLLDRIMADMETLQYFFVRVVSPIVVAIVVVLGMSFFVGGYLIECGILLAAGLLTNGLLIPAVTLWISRPAIGRMSAARSEISSMTIETLQGLEDLQANNAQYRWFERIKNEMTRAGKAQNQLNAINALGSGFYLLVMNLTVLGVLWASITQVRNENLSGVALAVLVLVAGASFEAVAPLPTAAANLNASLVSARRLFSINESKSPEVEKCVVSTTTGSMFAMRAVTFSYIDHGHDVLQNINLELSKGEKKAIVGVSGAGKSTLMDVLLGFQKPAAGHILVDGVDIHQIDPEILHQIFGIIPQSTYIFDANLRENLRIANVKSTEDELKSAISQAGLREWVESLPQGLDTWLGEHGEKMSAGERQRLSAARLILQDPAFVLMDEPTANLDPINERRLIKSLFKQFKNKGILLATHKLRLLESMDEILVLDKSNIVERGSYSELIQSGGLFKHWIDLDDDQIIFDRD